MQTLNSRAGVANSSRSLSETEIKVLARGFNFCPSLPDIPIVEYITATESYIQSAGLDEVNAALLRKAIIDQIEAMKSKQTYKPSKTNLSSEEWKALRGLQTDDSIIIIPADKGNKTIVLDKE